VSSRRISTSAGLVGASGATACIHATTLAKARTAPMSAVPPDVNPNQAPRVDVLASSPSTLLMGSS
jgi:hypothetical protein